MILNLRRAVVVVALTLAGCSSPQEGRTIVATVYPLAFAAERVAGPDWEVVDLTQPGVEAHDLELSLRQRAAIQEAAVVVYLGDLGFQPQVEEAVRDAEGEVVDATLDGGLVVRDGDPHLWLDPIYLGHITEAFAERLDELDPQRRPDYLESSAPFQRRVFALADRYLADLADCRYDTAIVTHEAFGYLPLGDVRQFGLSGVTPDAEPTADRLDRARELLASGEAGAVFFEEQDDARRVAESLAEDAGVSALPLSTLESRPTEGDYFTVMEDNLESLREGLGCR